MNETYQFLLVGFVLVAVPLGVVCLNASLIPVTQGVDNPPGQLREIPARRDGMTTPPAPSLVVALDDEDDPSAGTPVTGWWNDEEGGPR